MTKTPTTDDSEVLRGARANAIAMDLSRYDGALLAVSGGADSMALLTLVATAWRRLDLPSGKLRVATFDHGLRPESADEATFVANHCAKLGLTHETLVWTRKGARDAPSSGIQAQARTARYAQLGAHAERLWPGGRPALATAHTLDDQIETFDMRLQRGSGLDGLAAMRSVRFLDPFGETRLVRPLLDVTKATLRQVLSETGTQWREDPSNTNSKFERVRLRQARDLAGPDSVSPQAHRSTLRRLGDARDALDAACRDLAERTVLDLHRGAFALALAAPIRDAPAAVRTRFLMQLVTAFGGAADPPRLSRIERVSDGVANTRAPANNAAAWTVGGALVRLDPSYNWLMVCREPARTEIEGCEILPREPIVWDNRFQITAHPERLPSNCRLTVAPAARWLEACDDEVRRSIRIEIHADRAIEPHHARWAARIAQPSLPILKVPGARPIQLQVADPNDVTVRFHRLGWADPAL